MKTPNKNYNPITSIIREKKDQNRIKNEES